MLIDRREFGISLTGLVKPMRSDKFDVVVIGAGVFGSWIAHECLEQGKSVLLLDCRGAANSLASSGGESRILRVGYGPQETYSHWARVSLEKWRHTFSVMKEDALFVRSGVLWVGPDTDTYLGATAASLKRQAVSFELMDARQLRHRYPQMTVQDGLIGILENDSGYVLARRAVQAIVRDLIARGIEYRHALIRAPLPEFTGRLTELRTAAGQRIRATAFVFACGPWLPKLLPDVLGTCLTPTRQEVFFLAVPPADPDFGPARLPAWVDFRSDRIFYGVPDTEYRGFKVANDRHGTAMDPDSEERIATVAGLAEVRTFLLERFPRLSAAPCVESRVCQYENSPTGDFIIDRHPRGENVWIVGAGSGHGFKHGPAVGQHVRALLDGGAVEERFSIRHALSENSRAVHD
jgi:sarcosine oxidase